MSTGTAKTEVGSYFISNYPPFSAWSADQLDAVRAAMDSPPGRCAAWACICTFRFAASGASSVTFKVFTDKNSARSRALSGRAVARDRAREQAAGDGRAAVSVRLLRRRHAVVPELAAARAAGRSVAGKRVMGLGRGSHVRVRARHALGSEGPHAARNRRDAAQPGRRELRRRDPWRERPGA